MRSRALTYAFASLAALGVFAPTAAADGLPVPVEYTFGEGVESADGATRYVTLGGRSGTVVAEIATDGGKVLSHTTIDGDFTIPAIAVDGTASGLSADGSTLALINPRRSFPRKTTELVVMNAQRIFRRPAEITLVGDFSFDALSPDGRTMYLIEYIDPKDPGAYRVRSFDLETKTLDPEPILDSEEAPDEMRGLPQTRVTGPEGRWEYTLYDGGGDEPFIHALDVGEGATVCIDLPMVAAKATGRATLTMSADGGTVEMRDRKDTLLALVDTVTFKAREPGTAPEAASEEGGASDQSSALPTGLAAIGFVLLAAIAITRIRRMAG